MNRGIAALLFPDLLSWLKASSSSNVSATSSCHRESASRRVAITPDLRQSLSCLRHLAKMWHTQHVAMIRYGAVRIKIGVLTGHFRQQQCRQAAQSDPAMISKALESCSDLFILKQVSGSAHTPVPGNAPFLLSTTIA